MEWLHARSYPLLIITIIYSNISRKLKDCLNRQGNVKHRLVYNKAKKDWTVKKFSDPQTV